MAGSLSIAATAPGWDSAIAAMRAMPADLKRETTRRSRDLAEPLARELRRAGAAQGSHAARAAARVKSTSRGGLPAVTDRGLPYIMGSEYGGGVKRRSYYSTSRTGNRYMIVARHTTKQFRPFLGGGRGYWWTPQLEANGRGRQAVLQAWAEVVDDVLQGWG